MHIIELIRLRVTLSRFFFRVLGKGKILLRPTYTLLTLTVMNDDHVHNVDGDDDEKEPYYS